MDDSLASTNAPRRVDVAVAAVLLVFVVVGTTQIETDPAGRAVDWFAFACGIAASVSLVWWRRWSIFVAAIGTIALGLYLARGYTPGPILVPASVAIAGLSYSLARRVAWVGAVAMPAAAAIGLFVGGQAEAPHLLLFIGWGVAAALAGQAFAARGERAEAARERAAFAQQQALANERLRIAQDLHDSVAHAMATINVQSGVAAHLVEQKPEQVAVALEAIRVASRDALDELGAILGVLREPGSDAPLAPLAGLGDLNALVDRARGDGITIDLDQTGDVAAVPSTVGAAAYRAAQEALTNTRRHAGDKAHVTITVAVDDRGSLQVKVADDGGGEPGVEKAGVEADHRTSHVSSGFGLVGMRERVESSGGTLHVGPASPAGFVVEAVWPERTSE